MIFPPRRVHSGAPPPKGSALPRRAVEASGFTLIEVIVVIVIIAVIVGATMMSVSVGERSNAQEKSRRIISLMNNLSAEAILTGFPHGLEWNQGGRRLSAWRQENDGQWNPDRRFEDIALPSNWSLKLSPGLGEDFDPALLNEEVEVEEEEEYEDDYADEDTDEDEDKKKQKQPWIRFDPIGLWEPDGVMQILVGGRRQAMFRWTATGRVYPLILPPPEQEEQAQ